MISNKRVVPPEYRHLPTYASYDEMQENGVNGLAVIHDEMHDGRYEAVVCLIDGKVSRSDGPGEVVFGKGGRVVTEGWYRAGVHHRVDGGPAETHYEEDDTGWVSVERWWRNGRLHRINGPAEVMHDEGELVFEQWFFGHTALPQGRRDLLVRLGDLLDDELAVEISDSVFAPALDRGIHPRIVFDGIAAGVQTPEGLEAFIDGAPAEWVGAFEAGDRNSSKRTATGLGLVLPSIP